MLLEDKVAIVYGAGGAVGGAVARAFAAEGARVHLAGRSLGALDAVAAAIQGAGGVAEPAVVDALDLESVKRHAAAVAARGGRIDITFNAVGLGGAQGMPLIDMEHDDFAGPIATAVRTQFLTATAAARQMAAARSGVIMAITAQVARLPYPNVGGFGVACAAIEGFCRQLAAEVGVYGIRVVCLRSAGSPDAPGVDAAWRRLAETTGVSRDDIEAGIAARTMLGRLPTLAEVANAAVIMASDRASAITAGIANVTCGEVAD